MYIPFENLPEESKIWIYQSNRKFSDEEFSEIETALQSFLENWEAHSVGLESSYQLKYNRFIILAVNQEVQAATGCSIDASVQFIQKLEQKYNVDLLDKMNVTFKNGEHIAHKTLIDFKIPLFLIIWSIPSKNTTNLGKFRPWTVGIVVFSKMFLYNYFIYRNWFHKNRFDVFHFGYKHFT